jgi:prepilin-type N-terminal cleavage/methylation domain-containing protein
MDRARRPAFTLVELLVVIASIGIQVARQCLLALDSQQPTWFADARQGTCHFLHFHSERLNSRRKLLGGRDLGSFIR